MRAAHFNEVLEAAVQKYGKDFQMDMLVEKCAELIQAIQKTKRHCPEEERVAHLVHLCKELADVEIMMEQARLIIGKDGRDILEGELVYKISRLKAKVLPA